MLRWHATACRECGIRQVLCGWLLGCRCTLFSGHQFANMWQFCSEMGFATMIDRREEVLTAVKKY